MQAMSGPTKEAERLPKQAIYSGSLLQKLSAGTPALRPVGLGFCTALQLDGGTAI